MTGVMRYRESLPGSCIVHFDDKDRTHTHCAEAVFRMEDDDDPESKTNRDCRARVLRIAASELVLEELKKLIADVASAARHGRMAHCINPDSAIKAVEIAEKGEHHLATKE